MPLNMRTHFLIFILLFLSTIGQSQKLSLPKKPYVLVIDKYKFASETVIEHSPDLSGGLTSANFGGTQLEIPSGDTATKEPIYLNGDSLRLWTYLFKDDTIAIKYPKKIEATRVYDIETNKSRIKYDTTDHIDVNKIADTITIEQALQLINSEVQVYNGTKKMKLRRISVMLIWSNGKIFNTNYEKKRIVDYPEMTQMIKSLSGGHLIIDMVWYYNLENEQDGMSGAIAWKIK
jgi:hypothetical protein